MEQVAAGIGRQPQFGEDEDIDRLGLGPLHEAECAFGVEIAVGHAQLGRCRRDTQKTMMEHDETRGANAGNLRVSYQFWQTAAAQSPTGTTGANPNFFDENEPPFLS